MDEDWIEFSGRESPVGPFEKVRVRLRCGYRSHGYHPASDIRVWPRVTHYLLATPSKEE